MKVYNTKPVCLPIEVLPLKILLFSTTEVFSRFEVINAFVDRPVPEKLDIFLKLSSQKKTWPFEKCLGVVSHATQAMSHVAMLIASFHGLR